MCLAWLISLAGLLWLFVQRHALWTNELAQRISPGFHLGLLPMGGIGFLVFTVVGSILVVMWGEAAWQGEPLRLTLWVAASISLAFAGQTLAAGLYSVYAYGLWLAQTFPQPIFRNTRRLRQTVLRVAIPRIKAETNQGQTVTVSLIICSRTAQAGLSLKIRAETATNKVWEERYLKAVQPWRVVSDRWGKMQLCSRDGPLEYTFDLKRPYIPGEPILEGELIFPQKRVLPSVEEAILRTFASNR